MTVGIEQLFRSVAGADWASQAGGLTASEFEAALKDRAGADDLFGKREFKALGESLGLDRGDAKSIFDFLEKNGRVSVDDLRDQLMQAAGADKAFNLDEFKGGVDRLLDKATSDPDKADGARFGRDAGADKAIDKSEFEAIAERAGITDQEQIDKAFDKLAGADGEISRQEFKDGLGDTRLSKDELASKIKELAGEEKPDIRFNRAAGADRAMDEDEFAAIAKQAGIEDQDQIQEVFDQVAGADGEISKDEFKAAFGDSKLSNEAFASKFDELAQADSSSSSGSEEPSDAESSDTGSTASSPSSSDSASSADSGSESGEVWSHEVKDGKATINLGDKYTITAQESDATWTIKNNETGDETRIWGDPHVDVGNDGSTDFDFKKELTFELDDGTKISVGTVDSGNGTTMSSSLTITNGDNAIQVTGLGDSKDGANNLKVVQSNAGETLDDLTTDGVVTLVEDGADWITAQGQAITQSVIDDAEA